jgi:SAM-dependent MidA family methyltransferase
MRPDHAPTQPWLAAWELAHYGPNGFYELNQNPEQNFRTMVMDDPATSAKIFEIVYENYLRIGSPNIFTVMDAGSGNGNLAKEFQSYAAQNSLPWEIIEHNFSDGDIRNLSPIGGAGAVIAHELLDDIPCQVVELADTLNPLRVYVDPETGYETLGEAISEQEANWLQKWWPATETGARREIGLTRDQTWERLLTLFDAGCAIMIDYCTTQPDRERGLFDAGTLTGYRHGRVQRPIPDGSMNITAHVCLESLIDAGKRLGRPAPQVHIPLEVTDFRWLVQQL